MGRAAALFLGIMLLLGCGGGSSTSPPLPGFVNRTRHSSAELWTLWGMAQRSLSEQIDLNPLQRSLTNAPELVLLGDPRALTVEPRQLTVGAEKDVSSNAFFAATGITRADPTGLIACPQPCNVRFTPAYSVYQPPATKYAASWEPIEKDFDTLVEYEFENQILFALGYDLRWR